MSVDALLEKPLPDRPQELLPEPATVAQTGIDYGLILDLALKTIYYAGRPAARLICDRICLPFSIMEGALEFLRRQELIDIVGSNDDNMSPNKGGTATYPLTYTTGLSNNNWVSIPYHSKSDDAQGLCVELNNNMPKDASNVTQVIRFNPITDAPFTKNCANTLAGFVLKPGEGLILIPAATGKSAAFNVY